MSASTRRFPVALTDVIHLPILFHSVNDKRFSVFVKDFFVYRRHIAQRESCFCGILVREMTCGSRSALETQLPVNVCFNFVTEPFIFEGYVDESRRRRQEFLILNYATCG